MSFHDGDARAPSAGPVAARGLGTVTGSHMWARAREFIHRHRAQWHALRAVDPLRAWGVLGTALVGTFLFFERALVILWLGQPRHAISSDMAGYVDRAWRLADPAVKLNRFDAFFPPGTHILLTPAFLLTGDRDAGLLLNQVLWWLLAWGVHVLLGVLAWQLLGHPLAVALAMLGLYSHAAWDFYGSYFLSEVPFAFFMLATWAVGLHAWRRPAGETGWYALAGLLGGMTTLIRPQFVLCAVLLGLPLLRRGFPWVRVRPAVVLAGMFLIGPVFGVALNTRATGHLTGLATNGGFNFYQGHCPVDVVETRIPGAVYIWASPARLQRIRREKRAETRTVINDHMAWENDYFMRRGMECIRADGIGHLRRTATNLADFFFLTNPWPGSTTLLADVNLAVNMLYCALLFLAVPLAARRARSAFPERFILVQLAFMLPLPLLFYGDSRFRIPYDTWGVLLIVLLMVTRLRARHERFAPDGAPLP